MKHILKERTKRHIIIFTFIVLICGWIGVLIDQLLVDQPEGDTLGMLIWIVSPLACALILNFKSKDWYGFGHKVKLKQNVKWYVVSFLIFPVTMVIFSGIAWIFGALEVKSFNVSIVRVLFAGMIGLFIKNIFEEFAWRGFLTPKLIKVKLNDWMIYLIVGVVWALWHAAYYMVFLPEEIVETSRFGMIGISLIIIPIWGVMFTEIYRITGSVWPVVIMHMMEDAIPTFLIQVENIITFKGAAEFWLNPLIGVIPLILYLLFGLWLRKQRIRLNKPHMI